jgi:hypothetical protein
MMSRFEEIEKRINSQETGNRLGRSQTTTPMTPTRMQETEFEDNIIQKTGQKEQIVVSVKKLQRI